jgi:hypothetical protein
MKREMMRLALGGKWGHESPACPVVSPELLDATASAKSFGFNKEARAAAPMPVAERPKK